MSKKRDKNATILFTIFEIIYFGTRVISMPTMFANFSIALCGIICLLYCYLYKDKIIFNNVAFLAIVYSVFFSVSNIYTGNSDWAEVLWIWGYIGVALLMLNFEIYYQYTGAIFYLVIIYFILCSIRGLSSAVVITMGSRNTVSAIVLLYLFIYELLRYVQRKNIDLFSSMLAVITCFWGVGRAGILVSGLFLVALIFYNLFRHGYDKLKVIGITVITILVGYYLIRYYFYGIMETAITRFSSMGVNDVREKLYLEYLNETKNILKLIFGVPFSKNSVLSVYNNPHNSWLMLHAKFGFIPFIITVILLLKSLIRIISKKQWLILIIFLMAFLRCYIDWLSFTGAFDVIWWYFILSVSALKGSTLE